MKKNISFICASILLTACATQSPVRVVDGYGRMPVAQKETVHTSNDMLQAELVKHQMYRVQQGDTFSKIATFFNIEEDDLLFYNKLITAEQIKPGMMLKIPSDKKQHAVINEEKPSVNDMLAAKPLGLSSAQTVNQKENTYRLTDKYRKKDIPTPSFHIHQPKLLKHKIALGENMYRIGLKYGVSQFDIISVNEGVDPADLRVGQVILVPKSGEKIRYTQAETKVGIATHKNKNALKNSKTKQTLSKAEYVQRVKNAKSVSIPRRGMMWPARGKLIKTYGFKERGVTHSGINIALKELTPIRAADGGKVIYSDAGLEQYGNLILIRHNNGYVTAYAHNAYNHVQKGKWVKKGDVIALAGRSGSVDRSQLHFEVRKNAKAINPLSVLKK